MKGHPGYFGDGVDHCAKMINQIGSPNFKLLFDAYHVQVMNGGVIRRIRQYKGVIGALPLQETPVERNWTTLRKSITRP